MAKDKDSHPVVVSDNGLGPHQQTVRTGRHTLLADEADEPVTMGGNDAGPSPFDLLLASLGACTSITLRMYAEHKHLPLTGVRVELMHDRIEVEGQGKIDQISRIITLTGDLTRDQRSKLLAIANKCPMYRILHSGLRIDLHSGLRIDSVLADRDSAPPVA